MVDADSPFSAMDLFHRVSDRASISLNAIKQKLDFHIVILRKRSQLFNDFLAGGWTRFSYAMDDGHDKLPKHCLCQFTSIVNEKGTFARRVSHL